MVIFLSPCEHVEHSSMTVACCAITSPFTYMAKTMMNMLWLTSLSFPCCMYPGVCSVLTPVSIPVSVMFPNVYGFQGHFHLQFGVSRMHHKLTCGFCRTVARLQVHFWRCQHCSLFIEVYLVWVLH